MSADGEQGGVIQADRDAAEAIYAAMTEQFEAEGNVVTRSHAVTPDDDGLVQAFMRHRLAHAAPATDTPDAVSEAIKTVISVVQAYLPPDGISQEHFIERVIEAVDNPAAYAALAKHPTSPEDAA